MRAKHSEVRTAASGGRVVRVPVALSPSRVDGQRADTVAPSVQLLETGDARICKEEVVKRHEYEYRWDKKASECCPGRGKN